MMFPTDVSSSVPRLRHPAKDEWGRRKKRVSRTNSSCNKKKFGKLRSRYSKPVQAKENTDVRLAYRVDMHVFLVKAYFTFGVRTIAANTSHIIQTSVVGMLFYRVTEVFYADNVPDGSFFYEDQFMYEKFVLQPHSAYCVPSGTRCLTMTCQKNFFSTRRGGRCSVTTRIEFVVTHVDSKVECSTDADQYISGSENSNLKV
ncbi:uncharacterized protein CEXT_677201 [Caerostris extrusa]|uniref:Uncharacterized protein n=1 Tax=Caerostris extrusa TaxID=172846 RepID=A0AAV4NK26_CAEEX|nr:uncharacterized protein CEXT_677201 [Caerostris extrusa]